MTASRYGPFLFAIAMIAAILGFGFMLPTSEHLGSLMATVPAATAALAGARVTAAIAGLSCAACVVLDGHDGLFGTSTFVVHLVAIALVSLCVITFRTLRERSMRELLGVRAVAEAVQRVLIRPMPPSIGSLRIRAEYRASHPQALVGGDLYAVARTDGAVRFLIGDVKGKGLAAVDDAAALLGAFRSSARRTTSLVTLMALLEEAVQAHFEEVAATDPDVAERFITALLLEIPADGSCVRMINCGHPPPFLVDGDTVRSVPALRPAPPLGLNSTGTQGYATTVLPLAEDALLLLYTDGVIEARDPKGTFFDLEARIAGWPGRERDELLPYILDGLTAHVGGNMGLNDDAAMVTVQRLGNGSIHRQADGRGQGMATLEARAEV
ncbi:PP2C family protein-serine/threonine phosphatase [Streptomyces fagopyri]|uniref:PP2C family protein-serine/threonine phosphatase n=1 Tax=Streptomyces fagopyri TaxID=2662397 RepID=UPI001885A746|nr:PP2C family protein-serine/threonine phosphatase [Streptomyces fagopyri]